MTEWILSSSILILILVVLRACFKGRISLRLQYAIWGLVLLRLLIPVSFGSAGFSVANLADTVQNQPAVQAITDVGNLHISTQSYETAYHQVVQEYEAAGIDVDSLRGSDLEALEYEAYDRMKGKTVSEIVSDILVGIWVAGILVTGTAFIAVNASFRKKLLASRSGLPIQKDHMQVYATGRIDTPCLFGILKPAIYVTPSVAEDETLLRHTLEHEATHRRHGDHIWAILRCVCLAVHWYNPMVWWAAFLSRQDGELACDEATIRALGEEERAEYGRTLIGMTCQKKANVLITATTMTTGKGCLRERILLIAKKPRMALYTLLILVIAAAVAVGCTFTGAKEEPADQLSGTRVFTSEAQVTGMTIHALPGSDRQVDASCLPEMAQWALDFEYGEIIDSNAVMDPGTNTFSVTLRYADGTEQTACIDFEIVNGVSYRIRRSDPPDSWDAIWEEEPDETTPTETTPTVTIPIGPVLTLPGSVELSRDRDENKLCIAVQPDGMVDSGEEYLYIIPEQQEDLLWHYNAAVSAAHTDALRHSSDPGTGWSIVYQGRRWQFTESGAMYGTDEGISKYVTVDPENARALYEFCDGAVKAAGIGEPVRPSDIGKLKSATLYWNGEHRITERYALNRIETWFSNARELTSGAMCWFTAQLVLEMENGETKTVAIATDDCSAYMSEGTFYSFGEITYDGIEDNTEFYSLFAPALICEKSKEGMDAVMPYLRYLNWGRYSNQHDVKEVFALMDMIENWVAQEPTYERFGCAINWTNGLDGAYADAYSSMLGRLYALAPAEFAWACLGNATDEQEELTIFFLSYDWNMTREEVRQKLEQDLSKN